jgi:hypothetical protein
LAKLGQKYDGGAVKNSFSRALTVLKNGGPLAISFNADDSILFFSF